MYAADTELYLGSGYHIPLRAAYEYSETIELAGEGIIKRRWDGKAVYLGPTYDDVWNISIQATGWRRPAGLVRGCEVTLYSRAWQTEVIPQGTTQVILPRAAVPGSIRVEDSRGREVPHTLVGKTVIIAAPATETLAVIYRAVAECILSSIRQTAQHGSGDGDWAIDLAEKEPV